jgi:predicted transcriptional regulator
MKEQKTLNDYLKKNNLSIAQFSEITGVSVPHIYRFINNPRYSINVDIARKIYKGTKEYMGKGLGIWEYIEF